MEHRPTTSGGERRNAAHSELAALAEALRELGEREPTDVAGLGELKGSPVRLTYAYEDEELALHVRRTLGGPDDAPVRCAAVRIPAWLLDGGEAAPASLPDPVRADLVELVRGAFAVFEGRLAEYFAFAAGNDTVLGIDAGPPATLRVQPATTPSPRLQAALPTPERGYDPSGDPRQAGGARQNRGTGGTGVDGTHAPDADARPGNLDAPDSLGGAPRAIEGTLGQALVEGSPTDDDPPAASPGRLGH